jgi:uncharacterized damage-inducible protein DinB
MKETVEFYAEYNRKANTAMINILKGLPEEHLRKDTGTFFKTIIDTLGHVIIVDMLWLKRINKLIPYPCIAANDTMKLRYEEVTDKIQSRYTFAFEAKHDLDHLLRLFAGEVKEEDLGRLIRYKNLKGEEMERTYWHVILQIFTHEIHHRGTIAAMLDTLKIDNDFSSILQYVK